MPKTTNFSLSQAGTIGSEYIPDWKRRKAFNEEGEKWKEEEKNKKKTAKITNLNIFLNLCYAPGKGVFKGHRIIENV